MRTKIMTFQEALNRASLYCSRTEHCGSEVAEKLRSWGVSTGHIPSIIQKLEEAGFIDEARYAVAYVRDKYRFTKWGRLRIEQALRMKQVPQEAYQQAFDAIDEEEYMQILRQLLQNKRKTLKQTNGHEVRYKLVQYATGRGFTYDEIRQCLGELEQDDDD